MNVLKAAFMGIVHGFSEFLPISSSGHLALLKRIFNLNPDSLGYFTLMLNIGTLIAVIIAFREDIWGMIRETFGMLATVFANFLVFLKRKSGDTRYTYFKIINSSYRKLVLMIIISTIPTGVLGVVGRELAHMASMNLLVVGLCFVLTAVMLFLADKHPDGMVRVKDAPFYTSFFIGTVQGVASMPGISRTGATIAAGLMFGYNKKLAVKYSFIMYIPAAIGSIIVGFKDLKGEAFGSANLPGYLLGMVLAGVTGYLGIKLMLRMIKNKRYIGFSVYCLIIGLVSIGIFVFT
ncbi:MAG: undecaprenyl-diphosphate phosphatase [Butyrivibrio sp.]